MSRQTETRSKLTPEPAMPSSIWKKTNAVQTFKLGRHAREKDGFCPQQTIDHLWSRGGRNDVRYLKSCDHTGKIVVYGDNCVAIAKKIVASLNKV